MQSFQSPYFAAVDLGSNSFHMVVARVTDNKIEIVDREKEMVQIGRGLDNATLSVEAQQRALDCLRRFSERLQNIPTAQIRAVGTKTLRSAKNAESFLNEAIAALGAPIQIISGYEEARLVYAGLAHTVSNEERRRLVIDIGGGSTEFIIGQAYQPVRMESLGLGCASFTRKYFSNGVNKKNIDKAYTAACSEIQHISNNYRRVGWQLVFGTSGTMKAILELLHPEEPGAVISPEGLQQLISNTINHGGVSSQKLPKLRREVLPAGMAILQAIFDTLKLENIRVANATLKEGLIYDTVGRFSQRDSRVDTVTRLQEQYVIDLEQAKRVSDCALQLWQQISGSNIPGISRTKILDWAAQLHEIGLNISHSGYHHHGYYILKHSDLAGFGRYEQQILANLVKSQRKKIDADRLEQMKACAGNGFVFLMVCLRLAVVLHRRRETLTESPKIRVDNGKFSLAFSSGWLQNTPLTTAGLEQESHYLKNIGINLRFE